MIIFAEAHKDHDDDGDNDDNDNNKYNNLIAIHAGIFSSMVWILIPISISLIASRRVFYHKILLFILSIIFIINGTFPKMTFSTSTSIHSIIGNICLYLWIIHLLYAIIRQIIPNGKQLMNITPHRITGIIIIIIMYLSWITGLGHLTSMCSNNIEQIEECTHNIGIGIIFILLGIVYIHFGDYRIGLMNHSSTHSSIDSSIDSPIEMVNDDKNSDDTDNDSDTNSITNNNNNNNNNDNNNNNNSNSNNNDSIITMNRLKHAKIELLVIGYGSMILLICEIVYFMIHDQMMDNNDNNTHDDDVTGSGNGNNDDDDCDDNKMNMMSLWYTRSLFHLFSFLSLLLSSLLGCYISKEYLMNGMIVCLVLVFHLVAITSSNYPNIHGNILYGIIIISCIISRRYLSGRYLSGRYLSGRILNGLLFIGSGVYLSFMSDPIFTSIVETFFDNDNDNDHDNNDGQGQGQGQSQEQEQGQIIDNNNNEFSFGLFGMCIVLWISIFSTNLIISTITNEKNIPSNEQGFKESILTRMGITSIYVSLIQMICGNSQYFNPNIDNCPDYQPIPSIHLSSSTISITSLSIPTTSIITSTSTTSSTSSSPIMIETTAESHSPSLTDNHPSDNYKNNNINNTNHNYKL